MENQINSNVFNEKLIKPVSGWRILLTILIVDIILAIGITASFIIGTNMGTATAEGVTGTVISSGIIPIIIMITGVVLCVITLIFTIIMLCGLKVIKPNEAMVCLLFGKYYGTIKTAGFFFINPFVSAFNPGRVPKYAKDEKTVVGYGSNKISLKAMTLDNGKQKVNDLNGNPIEIGVIVIWQIKDTSRAVFNVENYNEYVSIQADATIRNIARQFPYDIPNGKDDELSLRGSSLEISAKLCEELQEKLSEAGIEIVDAKISHLAYAQEIASAMLQRQQAQAIVDARTIIVEGAVGMVQLALEKLSENDIVELDEERKAQMVSNLLVVLCSNKDAQPTVNSGSLY